MLDLHKNKYAIKLGLAPTRRILNRPTLFNRDDAIREKEILEAKLKEWKVDYVNLDFLNEEGLVYQGSDADSIARRFTEEGVDAVFAPHCNFGTEDAVAKIAKKLNKPLLIWGPRDGRPEPDGRRLRDSQCGLFATTRVLSEFGVPFTYIVNSSVNDEAFKRGFDNFMAAASVVKAFKGMRIGQLSTRPGSFWSVKANELELLERFGIEVVPLSLQDIKRTMDAVLRNQSNDVDEEIAGILSRVDDVSIPREAVKNVAALKIAMKNWAAQESLSAIAVLCTAAIRELTGVVPCFVMSELTDEGMPAICETDLHGAITAVMAQAAVQGRTPVFLADLTNRHPDNENAELLWHCGVFPHSLKKEGTRTALTDHYGAGVPGAARWEIKGGEMTIVRFDGLTGQYSLLVTRGKGVDGPETNGTYVWVEFKDWPKLERRFIYGPYIHHCIGVHEDITAALYEAARYIPGLKLDMVDPDISEME